MNLITCCPCEKTMCWNRSKIAISTGLGRWKFYKYLHKNWVGFYIPYESCEKKKKPNVDRISFWWEEQNAKWNLQDANFTEKVKSEIDTQYSSHIDTKLQMLNVAKA